MLTKGKKVSQGRQSYKVSSGERREPEALNVDIVNVQNGTGQWEVVEHGRVQPTSDLNAIVVLQLSVARTIVQKRFRGTWKSESIAFTV